MIRILLADDHTVLRESLAVVLRGSGDCVVVGVLSEDRRVVVLRGRRGDFRGRIREKVGLDRRDRACVARVAHGDLDLGR